MKVKEFKCPSCGSEAKFVFWIGNNFVEMDSNFKIVQSNHADYKVDQVLNISDIEKLVETCSTEGNEILSDCKKCSNDKTIEVVFDDAETIDGLAKNVLIEMKKFLNIPTTTPTPNGNGMTDYEREVEKLKKWIDGLKPKTVKAGRKAAPISIDDLKKKLYDACDEDDRDAVFDVNDDFRDVITSLKYSNAILQKDLDKVKFDTENCDVDYDIHNGVAYASCRAGGDWEMPLRFFVYFDGTNIRGYVPDEGNFYNKLTKTAFGSEGEADRTLPIFKKIDEMIANIKDGSLPFTNDGWNDAASDISDLAGQYLFDKTIEFNDEQFGKLDDLFFEPDGEEEFFKRLGI